MTCWYEWVITKVKLSLDGSFNHQPGVVTTFKKNSEGGRTSLVGRKQRFNSVTELMYTFFFTLDRRDCTVLQLYYNTYKLKILS